jgi:hypothetical protein
VVEQPHTRPGPGVVGDHERVVDLVIAEFADPVCPVVEVREFGAGVSGAGDKIVQVGAVASGSERARSVVRLRCGARKAA